MTGSFYVGAYWLARPESLGACTSRALQCFAGLVGVDRALATWLMKGSNRSDAITDFAANDESAVSAAFARGQNRRDSDGSVLEDLGFALSVWNGDDAMPVSLSIRCGIRAPNVSNAVVVKVGRPTDHIFNLDSRAAAARLLRVLIEAWDPDWATMTSNAMREAQSIESGQPVLGWLTYLSAIRGPVPVLTDPFSVEPVDGKGTIIAIGQRDEVDGVVLRALSETLGHQLLRPAP